MFNLKLKNKYYLLIVIIFLSNGCSGEESSSIMAYEDNKNYFLELDYDEEETLSNLNTTQQELLDAINAERAQSRTCGDKGTYPAVPALTWNSNLYAAALEHVTDLAYSDTFSHDGSGTEYDITGNGEPSKFYERIERNGYTNYYSVGENIAGGQREVSEVMSAWMASPGHCVNIMKSTYTEVGVAVIIKEDSSYQVYWGQNFGSKRQ